MSDEPFPEWMLRWVPMVPRREYDAMVAARDHCKQQTADLERRYQESQKLLHQCGEISADLAARCEALRQDAVQLTDELNTARRRLYVIGETAAQERADEAERLAQVDVTPASPPTDNA